MKSTYTASALRLFKHTKKAVRAGHPEDRIFLAVKTWKAPPGEYACGWKCTLTPEGLKHPAFAEVLPLVSLADRVIAKGTNCSEPPDTFKIDSTLTEINVADLGN